MMKLKCTSLVSRLAQVSLFLVLLLLTAFSIGMALLNQQAVSRTEAQTSLSMLYWQSLQALSQEELSLQGYLLIPSASVRSEHQAAAETLRGLFARLQQSGDADDKAMVSAESALHDRDLVLSEQLFAAVDAHDLTRASLIHSRDIDPLLNHIQAQVRLQAGKDQADESRVLAQLAQTQRLTLIMTPVVFVTGFLLIAVLWRILQTYRKQNEASQDEIARLKHVTVTDPLTGLGNYYAYQESLVRLSHEALRAGESLVLALLDIDEFKIINDEQGHQRGNDTLLAFATVLRETTPSPWLFRLGADDFAVLLPRTLLAEATLESERVCEAAQQGPSGVTVSIGVTPFSSHDLTLELFQAQATSALEEAKRRGRNRVVTFDAMDSQAAFLPLEKRQAVRRLLSEGKLAIAFQPIWNLATGTILAFEALTRPDAGYGFSGPQELFDIAEQMGRAHELDALCIEKILARAAELPPDALLFLNLTPQSLVHDVLTGATLLEKVVNSGLEASRVVLEITERSIVKLEEIVQKTRLLRLMGFRIALDDAGAGNAGLEMLSQLPVDFVKIDRAVVVNALTHQAARSVFAGISAIAREADLAVVAEGIENAEQLAFVQRAGVQYAQGYVLGRPSETISQDRAWTDRAHLISPGTH